ncbi:MAG: ankyrin repeat domain-containing protein [Oceanicoccus sp.]
MMVKINVSTLFPALLLMSIFASAETDKRLPFELKRLLLEKQYDVLNEKLSVLASSGDGAAQYQLGVNFEKGLGVAVDIDKSLTGYQSAADQGYVKAQFSLAILLFDQPAQRQRAIQYLEMAAGNGHSMAAKKLHRLGNVDTSTRGDSDQKLLYGAKHGKPELVVSSCNNGADPNVRNEVRQTALHLAVGNNQPQLVEKLLKCGVPVTAVDEMGNSVLHYAVKYDVTDILESIAIVSDIELRNEKSQTALMLAIVLGKQDMAVHLIEMGANINARDSSGRSMIELAEQKDLGKVLQVMKKTGSVSVLNSEEAGRKRRIEAMQVQLQQATYSDWNLLMLASWMGDEDVVKWLLVDAGKTESLISALEISLERQHRDIASMLSVVVANRNVTGTVSEQLVKWSIEADDLDSFVLLSGVGEQFNLDSQLWYAIHSVSLEISHYLVAKDIDVNYLADDGSSFLHQAAGAGSVELVQKLLAIGAQPDSGDLKGLSALRYAIEGGHTDIADMIIISGADVNTRDTKGHTPLLRAVVNNNFDLTKLLVEKGADLESRTTNGNTVLIAAAEKSSPSIVEYLLRKNSEVEARNKHSYTALMAAVQRGERQITELLLKAGADPSRRNRNGKNALMMSVDETMLAILRDFD